MKTDDFDYYLPEELIAQSPLQDRSSSKMLVLDKVSGQIKHEKFNNIINYFKSGDVLVLNNTKVLPARLHGIKIDTKAHIEILLLKEVKKDVWECLVKPAKRIKVNDVVEFSSELSAVCTNVLEDGLREMKLIYKGILYEILEQLGEMPLPPYIKNKLNEKDRYQTVYAKEIGSSAAPTAGLHFTKEILEQLKNKGVNIVYITLHVGLGTFRPVSIDDITKHQMHSEYYMIDEDTANILNTSIENNNRIICVGTTTVRTLETVYSLYNTFKKCSGDTNIFIYPGYEFKVVKHLITNFHLPKSTLIMLISALAGKDNILNAYKEAVLLKYRFFSFGDSMFITDL